MHVRYETVARWERGVQSPSPLAITNLRRVLLVPEVAKVLTDELRRSIEPPAAAATA